jgi:hypothetical protein
MRQTDSSNRTVNFMPRLIVLLLGSLFSTLSFQSFAQGVPNTDRPWLDIQSFAHGVPDTDRPGMDIRGFDQQSNSPSECANACMADVTCKSWTYGKPGTNGTNPDKSHCWLKWGTPPAVHNSCCTSGGKLVTD